MGGHVHPVLLLPPPPSPKPKISIYNPDIDLLFLFPVKLIYCFFICFGCECSYYESFLARDGSYCVLSHLLTYSDHFNGRVCQEKQFFCMHHMCVSFSMHLLTLLPWQQRNMWVWYALEARSQWKTCEKTWLELVARSSCYVFVLATL